MRKFKIKIGDDQVLMNWKQITFLFSLFFITNLLIFGFIERFSTQEYRTYYPGLGLLFIFTIIVDIVIVGFAFWTFAKIFYNYLGEEKINIKKD